MPRNPDSDLYSYQNERGLMVPKHSTRQCYWRCTNAVWHNVCVVCSCHWWLCPVTRKEFRRRRGSMKRRCVQHRGIIPFVCGICSGQPPSPLTYVVVWSSNVLMYGSNCCCVYCKVTVSTAVDSRAPPGMLWGCLKWLASHVHVLCYRLRSHLLPRAVTLSFHFLWLQFLTAIAVTRAGSSTLLEADWVLLGRWVMTTCCFGHQLTKCFL